MRKIFGVFAILICIAFSVIAGCEHKSTPPESDLVATLVNENKAAGRYTVMWRQIDDQSKQVAAGSYLANLKADSYENNAGFQISATAPKVPYSCDTVGGQLPTSFTIAVDSSIHALGDTICIRYELPASAQVLLTIKK